MDKEQKKENNAIQPVVLDDKDRAILRMFGQPPCRRIVLLHLTKLMGKRPFRGARKQKER